MMLSNSRIYIFGVKYKKKVWLEILDTNELAGTISNIFSSSIPELEFKSIQIFNCFEEGGHSCEIHINKLKYKERRIIEKEDIRELRKKLMQQLKKIPLLIYEQLHIVNDEFSKQPSSGFLTEDVFYA